MVERERRLDGPAARGSGRPLHGRAQCWMPRRSRIGGGETALHIVGGMAPLREQRRGWWRGSAVAAGAQAGRDLDVVTGIVDASERVPGAHRRWHRCRADRRPGRRSNCGREARAATYPAGRGAQRARRTGDEWDFVVIAGLQEVVAEQIRAGEVLGTSDCWTTRRVDENASMRAPLLAEERRLLWPRSAGRGGGDGHGRRR